jgi:glutathione synthase/RimK-type ligase-like ATP-grasp enzyme
VLNRIATQTSKIYNTKSAKLKVSSKWDFHKLNKDCPYLPKTALNVKDAESLSFPIIAKPSNGHSGIGIKAFKTLKSFKASNKDGYSVFCEKIEVLSEWRYFIFKGEILCITKRIPQDNSTKNILLKNVKDTTNFKYLLHYHEFLNVENEFDIEHLLAIQCVTLKHQDLDFYAIDLADTPHGVKVFEINSQPGNIFGVVELAYRKIFKDYYKRDIDMMSARKFRESIVANINLELEKPYSICMLS